METGSVDLRKYSYFSSLSDSAIDSLSSRITPVNFRAGSVIVKEGAVGDSFYFVREGQLEVTTRAQSGVEAKLAVIGKEQGFGEMALLTGSIRSSSVTAITSVKLYQLSKKDFEDIVLNDFTFKKLLLRKTEDFRQINNIKTFQPFALLDPARMCGVLEKMTEKEYAPGENIVVQGEKGDAYFIIRSGRVSVLKKKKGDGSQDQIAELGEGDAFGEEALIRDDPRNATCQAIVATSVYVLYKKDFDQMIKAAFLENIFPEEISVETYLDEYIVIDARVPAEYEEEHIHGAINIPVEVLRRQCAEFDRSRQYITYCLNDSRGMVAAFLLKNRGFNARCLRGGISGWPGPLVTGTDMVHMPQP